MIGVYNFSVGLVAHVMLISYIYKMLPDEFTQQSYFVLQELVPKNIYNRYGDSSVWFINREAFNMLVAVRVIIGKPCTVNNWHIGGLRNYSGFRPRSCSIGGSLSQHRLGSAFDTIFEGMSSDDVYAYILANQSTFLTAGVRAMENKEHTRGWTHLDHRWTGLNHILIVNPSTK